MSDIESARRTAYDLTIIGGGIYGVMLLLESARRGYRVLLLEKDEFGSGVSSNHLRIVHGGLRYLQGLQLSRYRESVAERQWFLAEFPDLVRPLPCLMPLYGGLARHPVLLRAALFANDLLSASRNNGVLDHNHLANGRILTDAQVRSLFPQARSEGLRGGAMWCDAVMSSSEKILENLITWATTAGALAFDRIEAIGLHTNQGAICGLRAHDWRTGQHHVFQTRAIVNTAGPSVDRVVAQLGLGGPRLFVPSLAWNLLFDRPPIYSGALAIEPPRKGSRVYFAHSLDGKLFIGTGHAAVAPDEISATVPRHEIEQMVGDINASIPGTDLRMADIQHIYSGLLPVARPRSTKLCTQARIVRHSDYGGPTLAVSVAGVKFTTARSTAVKVLDKLNMNTGRDSTYIPLC